MKKWRSIVLVWCMLLCGSRMTAQEYSVQFFDDTDGLSHGHISQIAQDTTGMIWIATWNGINRYDGTHFAVFKPSMNDDIFVPNDIVRRLVLRRDNNLLCRIENRVLLFDTKSCTFDTLPADEERQAYEQLHEKLKPEQQIPKGQTLRYGKTTLPNILNEFVDRQGNIWSVSSINGLYRSTPLPSCGRLLGHEEVRSMARLKDGTLIAANRYSQQLQLFDTAFTHKGYLTPRGELSKLPVSFENLIYCIFQTREGQLLLGRKPGGLIEFDHGRKRIYDSIPNIYDIRQDKDGNVWVATFGYGIWRGVRENGKKLCFTVLEGTENLSVRRLFLYDDGTLLAATTAGLLVVDDMYASQPVVRIHSRRQHNRSSLSSNAVMCVAVMNGKVYVGTEGGGVNTCSWEHIHDVDLAFEQLTPPQGVAGDIIYEMIPWDSSELVIQTKTALHFYNTQTSQMDVFGKSFFNNPEVCKYGEVAPLKIDDRQILTASAAGLYLFDEKEAFGLRDSVRIALHSMYRSNAEIAYNVDDITELTLEPNHRTVVLSFSALDYRNNSDILYSTRLYKSGEHQDWGPLNTVSDIVIQDIQPGDYIFEIRSTDAFGHLLDNTRRIAIHVPPTFLESTWGKAVVIVLLLCIVIAITVVTIQLQVARKKRTETLEAYLEIQERLALIEKQRIENPQMPLPEILSTGYMSQNEQFMNALHHFMEENIDNNEILIADMAHVTGMSRASLNRKMKELFGLTPKDFVQTARIKHACSLLQTTDMSAKEIAYACGFSDQRYFSKCFKSETGKTPTEYRTNLMNTK